MGLVLRAFGLGLAIAFLALTVINASWLASEPKGSVKLVAQRGLNQLYNPAAPGAKGAESAEGASSPCTAGLIEQPYHPYLENTADSAARAQKLGAAMIKVDVALTQDEQIVVFRNEDLACRTNGKGAISDATLEELKTLDIGYGYSADGGKSFPFRGKFVGGIETLEDFLPRIPRRTRVMFQFTSNDPLHAEALLKGMAGLGRNPIDKRDAFYGPAEPIALVRKVHSDAWSWTREEAQQCSDDYVLYGWTSILPQSCRGKTMVIPLNRQFWFWGWPNRLTERMAEYGGEIIITAPPIDEDTDTFPSGLTFPEQLGDIPSTANAYIWVEDAFTIPPALFERLDHRNADEYEAAKAALERRRQAQ